MLEWSRSSMIIQETRADEGVGAGKVGGGRFFDPSIAARHQCAERYRTILGNIKFFWDARR